MDGWRSPSKSKLPGRCSELSRRKIAYWMSAAWSLLLCAPGSRTACNLVPAREHGPHRSSFICSSGQTSPKFNKEIVPGNVTARLREWFFCGSDFPKGTNIFHNCLDAGRDAMSFGPLLQHPCQTVVRAALADPLAYRLRDQNSALAAEANPANSANRYSTRCAPPAAWHTWICGTIPICSA